MNNPKTILYIGGFELPDGNAAAQRVISNAKILRDLDFEVIFLGGGKDKGSGEIENISHTYKGFLEFKSYPRTWKEWFRYLTSASPVVDFIKEELKYFPQTIIAYNYPGIALNRLRKFCKNENIRLYSDCTEWYEPQGNIFFKVVKGFDTLFRMKYVHPKLDGIITISRYLFDYYSRLLKNVILLPPLVDKQMDKWKNQQIQKTSEFIELVYAGSPGKGKKDRLDQIINALAVIKTSSTAKVKLTIIGLTKEDYYSSFGNSILNDDQVIFKGRLSHLESLSYLKNADFSIFIRDMNLVNTAGFPTKFVESISCGIPVLTNLSSNIDEYLQDGVNGFILDISDDITFVESLQRALSVGEDKIREMKINCNKDKRFDYHNYIQTVRDFLN